MTRYYPAIDPDQIPKDWKEWRKFAKSAKKMRSLVKVASKHSKEMELAVGLALSAAKWITGYALAADTQCCGLCFVPSDRWGCWECLLVEGSCMQRAEAGESMKLYIEHMEKYPHLRRAWMKLEVAK